MEINVDDELCIGCGICENICVDIFEMKDDDISHVKINSVSVEHRECALEAENEFDLITYED